MVIGGIKNFIIDQVIKAGITWLIALLNPAAAFIKACKAIYDIIMFFIERGRRSWTSSTPILDSIGAIAKGTSGSSPTKVEDALAKALPLAISFLASLLGLGGISDKIREIIQKVQRRSTRPSTSSSWARSRAPRSSSAARSPGPRASTRRARTGPRTRPRRQGLGHGQGPRHQGPLHRRRRGQDEPKEGDGEDPATAEGKERSEAVRSEATDKLMSSEGSVQDIGAVEQRVAEIEQEMVPKGLMSMRLVSREDEEDEEEEYEQYDVLIQASKAAPCARVKVKAKGVTPKKTQPRAADVTCGGHATVTSSRTTPTHRDVRSASTRRATRRGELEEKPIPATFKSGGSTRDGRGQGADAAARQDCERQDAEEGQAQRQPRRGPRRGLGRRSARAKAAPARRSATSRRSTSS